VLFDNSKVFSRSSVVVTNALFVFRLNAFLEGFYDIIPMRLISIFNEQELELLISGLPNVDIDDLKANTEYHKYQSTSLQVRNYC
jgi:HECT-domain (ubiquitin-transferase)